MVKVILVIAFLVGLFFVVQGFLEVASAPDLFERSENEYDLLDEVKDE